MSPSSSFQSKPPSAQHTGRPLHVSLERCKMSNVLTPVWGVRLPDAPGRTANFLTPGGYSEEGVIDFDGEYRTERSHPGTSPSHSCRARRLSSSSSFSAPRPSLSSSNISYTLPPSAVSATFPRPPMPHPSAVHVPDFGSFPHSFHFGNLNPTAVAFNLNLAGPSNGGMQAGAWEQHHQSLFMTSPEAFPTGMQASNYYTHDHHLGTEGDASPLGPLQYSNFSDHSAEPWHTPSNNTSPYYTFSPYSYHSASTTSLSGTSSHGGYLDTPSYHPDQDPQQNPSSGV